jgi:hypothetical protein
MPADGVPGTAEAAASRGSPAAVERQESEPSVFGALLPVNSHKPSEEQAGRSRQVFESQTYRCTRPLAVLEGVEAALPLAVVRAEMSPDAFPPGAAVEVAVEETGTSW